jgi:predicted DNA-binding WGR domain protein
MRRFEFVEGTSKKFWEIDSAGPNVTVRFGRIGTDGQIQVKAQGSPAAALSAIEKLIREKTGKGYTEVTSGAPTKSALAEKGPAERPATRAAPSASAPAKKNGKEPGWIDAGGGYALSLVAGKLAARKNGASLASVPKPLKEGELAERLLAAAEFLASHDRTCVETVETWMLRSLSTPRKVLSSVFRDASWRKALENAVVVPVDKDGRSDRSAMGFFRGVDAKRGVGIVDADGETQWLDAPSVWIPHPVVLGDALDDLRGLATELSLTQGIAQLFREIFVRPKDLGPKEGSVRQFARAEFEMLSHAMGAAKSHGYRVTGGSAVCRVWERGRVYEARFHLGDGDPSYETTTGDLEWVDDKQKPLLVAEVPPIAYSEGMRMAATVYAKRKIEKKEGE